MRLVIVESATPSQSANPTNKLPPPMNNELDRSGGRLLSNDSDTFAARSIQALIAYTLCVRVLERNIIVLFKDWIAAFLANGPSGSTCWKQLSAQTSAPIEHRPKPRGNLLNPTHRIETWTEVVHGRCHLPP